MAHLLDGYGLRREFAIVLHAVLEADAHLPILHTLEGG
jgi:hypothetical protein